MVDRGMGSPVSVIGGRHPLAFNDAIKPVYTEGRRA
jgi:hypothetical protein